MAGDESMSQEVIEHKMAVEAILKSDSPKKLVVAGPGTGKTALFRSMLEIASGEPDERIVLTFINNLRDDLEKELGDLAKVFTLHSYCLGLLYREETLRDPLSSDFRCLPRLASVIADDWRLIEGSNVPKFVGEMRSLADENHIPFYLARGEYYDAVDFDDSVYRVFDGIKAGRASVDRYKLVLVDEYQDFNALEAEIINLLGGQSRIMIVGDDDQALYSQLRNASWEHIRRLRGAGEYKSYDLPFCMRCPKVVVDAVRDIITVARELDKLEGRIDKPYKHFPPAKRADSEKYPKIVDVETSVQRKNANYMGRYIAQAITTEIPPDEVKEAKREGFPAALVIVAKPYREQIADYLAEESLINEANKFIQKPNRETGLSILKEDPDSNLGWRIILGADSPPFLREAIKQTADGTKALNSFLPSDYCERVLKEVDEYESLEDDEKETSTEVPLAQVTTFEGAKGLSAQHVFIAGLHDGEIPQDPAAIKDLEICKFVVGLTRTHKKCTLLHTRRFGNISKSQSTFISWIAPERLNFIKVDSRYWK